MPARCGASCSVKGWSEISTIVNNLTPKRSPSGGGKTSLVGNLMFWPWSRPANVEVRESQPFTGAVTLGVAARTLAA